MTVALVSMVQRWMGLSSDAKPTTPPIGASFYETDTGQTYVYASNGWQLFVEVRP